MANPWTRVMPLIISKEAVERHRRVDATITQDARVDVSRATRLLAPESRPTIDADQVFPEGFDADDLQELLDTNLALLATIAGLGFLTKAAESTLSNEFALGSLATGLLKNTTTTGIPTIAVANTDYLPVASPTATGTLTTDNLTATGDSTLGNAGTDITQVWGHFKHKGASTPSIAVGAALGTGGSVGATITGTNQVGEVVLTAGTTSLTTGLAATITFATARPDTNYVILLKPRAVTAATDTVKVYATRATTTTWEIRFVVAPASGNAFAYQYLIVEWTN